MSKKIADIVTWGKSTDQITLTLREQAAKLRGLISSIDSILERSNARVAFANLGKRTALEIERLASLYPSSIEGVAWCTRNLFELNLILRFVMMDARNLDVWLGQLAGDEMQIIEGSLSLARDSKQPAVQTLKDRLTQIAEVCERHGINPSKPLRMDNLAKIVNCTDDYTALYKLFSKYVHPSSWLVNSPESTTNNPDTLNIFLIHSQIYSWDTYGRLDEWLKKQR